MFRFFFLVCEHAAANEFERADVRFAVIYALTEEVKATVVRNVYSGIDAWRIRLECIASKTVQTVTTRSRSDEFRISDKSLRVVRNTVLPRAEITIVQKDASRRNSRMQFFVILADSGVTACIAGSETPLTGSIEDVVPKLRPKFSGSRVRK